MVCLIGYNETTEFNRDSEEVIKESIEAILIDKCKSLEQTFFDAVAANLLARINYILFPVWKLDELVEEFQNQIR